MTLPITASGRNTLTWSTEYKIWNLHKRICLKKKEKNTKDFSHIRRTDKDKSRHWIKCGDIFFLRYVNRAELVFSQIGCSTVLSIKKNRQNKLNGIMS